MSVQSVAIQRLWEEVYVPPQRERVDVRAEQLPRIVAYAARHRRGVEYHVRLAMSLEFARRHRHALVEVAGKEPLERIAEHHRPVGPAAAASGGASPAPSRLPSDVRASRFQSSFIQLTWHGILANDLPLVQYALHVPPLGRRDLLDRAKVHGGTNHREVVPRGADRRVPEHGHEPPRERHRRRRRPFGYHRPLRSR